jgi:uncharacterized HhH-GPD family protein
MLARAAISIPTIPTAGAATEPTETIRAGHRFGRGTSIGSDLYHRTMPNPPVDRLPFTDDDEANRLLVDDPFALLIGFTLDQQVPLQKAFSGPLELRRRIGPYDARRIATMDPEELDAVFRRPPALHRFPSNMAKRTQAVAAYLVEQYGGDASRIWREAKDGADLHRRLLDVPGVGPMKAGTLVAILGKQLGVAPSGWESQVPDHMTLGDVDGPARLREYQGWKKAMKAAAREAAGE